MLALWHLALTSDWEKAVGVGSYAMSTRGWTVQDVGFVHASFDLEQVGRVAAAAYADVDEALTLLAIDPYALADAGIDVRSEVGDVDDPAQEQYPHLYGGPVPTAAVIAALPAHMAGGALTLDEPPGQGVGRFMDVREAAYGLVTDDSGRYLLARLTGGPDDGVWTLPGGGLEAAETPEEAVVREVFEETGLDVDPGALLGVDIIVIPSTQRLAVGTGPLAGVRWVHRPRVTGGALRPERGGSTDLAAWHASEAVAVLPCVELVDVGLRMLRGTEAGGSGAG